MPDLRSTRVLFYMPLMAPLLGARSERLTAGGAETQIFLLAREFAKRGAQATLVVRDGQELPLTIDGVRIFALPRWASFTNLRLVGKLVEALGIGWAVLRTRPTTIVQRLGAPAAGLCAIAAKLSRSAFIWSSANVRDFRWSDEGMKGLDLALLRLGVRLASTVVVQSHEQAVMCEGEYGREALVIRSVVEGTVERPTSRPERSNRVLWATRLAERKRPLDLLDIARRAPSVEFLMVVVPTYETSSSLETAVRTEADKLANVQVLEAMPREDLLALMDTCMAVASTSEAEGMANIFLEGWSRGIPALTLHHDPDGLIHRSGVGLAANGDSAAAAEYLSKLAISPAEQDRVADRCRGLIASEFSVDVVMTAWASAVR